MLQLRCVRESMNWRAELAVINESWRICGCLMWNIRTAACSWVKARRLTHVRSQTLAPVLGEEEEASTQQQWGNAAMRRQGQNLGLRSSSTFASSETASIWQPRWSVCSLVKEQTSEEKDVWKSFGHLRMQEKTGSGMAGGVPRQMDSVRRWFQTAPAGMPPLWLVYDPCFPVL